MEIVYDESTGTWSEREEPYTTLDVQTEEDWNKLEFMINNFSRLEDENAELKRLLKIAVEDLALCTISCIGINCDHCHFTSNFEERGCKWKHAEEALEVLRDEK